MQAVFLGAGFGTGAYVTLMNEQLSGAFQGETLPRIGCNASNGIIPTLALGLRRSPCPFGSLDRSLRCEQIWIDLNLMRV
jgi:hypothetical protein